MVVSLLLLYVASPLVQLEDVLEQQQGERRVGTQVAQVKLEEGLHLQ
jgi:hypothetical protein